MSGALKKMRIEAYADADQLKPIGFYELMLNPQDFSRSVKMGYATPKAPGVFSPENLFSHVNNELFGATFMIDGIGTTGQKRDVTTDVEKFLLVCGKVPGNIRRPNYLRITWGGLVLSCVLIDASIKYTLFKPDGTPIRAMVTANFKEDRSKLLQIIEEGIGTVINTNFREVAENIDLPQLCQEVYGDPTLYIQVAKANGIVDVRNIPVGTQIEFPPLK